MARKKKAVEPDHNQTGNYDEQPISKSERKRQMRHLQELGKALIESKSDLIKSLPISEKLTQAIETAPTIKKHEALRRHIQFIGKLMRSESAETIKNIESRLNDQYKQHKEKTDTHHAIEHWRDEILQHGSNVIEQFIQSYPQAERQWLQQILRQHHNEKSNNKPPVASRKLFDYIRNFIQN